MTDENGSGERPVPRSPEVGTGEGGVRMPWMHDKELKTTLQKSLPVVCTDQNRPIVDRRSSMEGNSEASEGGRRGGGTHRVGFILAERSSIPLPPDARLFLEHAINNKDSDRSVEVGVLLHRGVGGIRNQAQRVEPSKVLRRETRGP